jgi:AcrR family transcriptional regulator
MVAAARVAKMTLYCHFPSKDELILAYLQRRAQLWIDHRLRDEAMRRAAAPGQRLLAVFDAFDDCSGDAPETQRAEQDHRQLVEPPPSTCRTRKPR